MVDTFKVYHTILDNGFFFFFLRNTNKYTKSKKNYSPLRKIIWIFLVILLARYFVNLLQ